MSCLSLPVARLCRLQVTVKLSEISLGALAFTLQPHQVKNCGKIDLPSTSSNSSGYTVNLQTDVDDAGQAVLRVYASMDCDPVSPPPVVREEAQASAPIEAPMFVSAVQPEQPTFSPPFAPSQVEDVSMSTTVSSNVFGDEGVAGIDFMGSSSTSSDWSSSFSSPSIFPMDTYNSPATSASSFDSLYTPSTSNVASPFTFPSSFDFPWEGQFPNGSEETFLPTSSLEYHDKPLPLEVSSTSIITFEPSNSNSNSNSSSSSSPSPMLGSTEMSDYETTVPSSDESQSRKKLRCLQPGCDRRFTSLYTLRVHTEAHKPKSRQTHFCTLGCSEKFSRRHDRLRHEVTQHGKVCEFVCSDCNRFFSSEKTLRSHRCPAARGSALWAKSTPTAISNPQAS